MATTASDPYGLGTIAGNNIGIPGANTGGLTARARPNQPSLGPPAGPKPVSQNPTNGAQQPTQELPNIGVTSSDNQGPVGTTGSVELVADAIGSFVQEQFTKMRNDRIQTDALLLRCLYARKGEYTPEELSLISGGADTEASAAALLHTYFPMVGTKCRAGEAWIADIFTGTEGRL